MSRRTHRVASLIQDLLGDLLVRKMKDPRLGLVTITRVEVPPDLKSAHVYYSVMGGDKEKAEGGRGLEHSAGFLQHEIAVVLKLRYTPKLIFHLDESLEESLRIQKILKNLEEERAKTSS